jgi:hypothetical protein
VITIGSRVHVAHANHRAEIEFAIEMRKQFVVAGGFPAQRVAQRVGVDLDQEQSGLPEEMLPGRLRHLRRCGKMNEAVADIVGAAPIHALPFGLAPGRSGTDFVDPAHLPGVLPAALSLLGNFRNFRTSRGPYRRALRTSRVAFRHCAALRKPAD